MLVEAEPDLKGKVVVITGAARGLGGALTRGFLSAGARVVATDKSWANADEIQSQVQAQGGLALEMDVVKNDQIEAAFQAAMARYHTIDVVVNNAALLQMALFKPTGRVTTLETTDEDWAVMLDVNVRGPLRVIRKFIQPMLQNRSGSIINVVSNGVLAFSRGGAFTALRPSSKEMPYMATKAALANVSFYLADEVKEHNIAVNIIFPGHTRASWFDETVRYRISAGMAPGLRPVVPEHAVPLVRFLASQNANTVTGRLFDTLEWNRENGLGGYETWMDKSLPEDIERAFSAGAR